MSVPAVRRLFGKGDVPSSRRGDYVEVAQGERDADVELDAYSSTVEGVEGEVVRVHRTSELEAQRYSIDDLARTSTDKLNESVDEADFDDGDVDAPTEEERRKLRKVADRLPWSTFLIAVVELCERFAYYGISGPFQNYIANKYHDPSGLPGAIGLGQAKATALTSFFQFWCYVTPILGAVMADQFLGKYRTIVYFSIIYAIGILILFATSLPISIQHGAALPGLVTAMVVIGLGTGGIKSNVSPLIAEQYQETKQRLKILKNGERVIVDPNLTIQRIYMIFYLCINVGSLSSIVTTNLEKYVGYWSAYFLPFLMFIIGFFVLVSGKEKYVVRPPKGSVMVHCFKALWIGVVNKGQLRAARPSYQVTHGNRYKTPWDEMFIDELSRALMACKVFLFFPIYWLTFNQMSNNFVSQAGQMQLHGIPNDVMQNIDPLTLLFLIPIMDRIVYPLLRRMGISFKPITRIFFGFLFASAAMFYAALVQHIIYSTKPCYTAPANCDAAKQADGSFAPNDVDVFLQAPSYLLIAISEIFASVTGLEYAFTKAPSSMKSFIMSMFLLTNAFGAALGLLVSPSAADPYLTWMYVGLAVASLVAAVVFWVLYSKYNRLEDEMNDLREKPGPGRNAGIGIQRGESSRRIQEEDEDYDMVPLRGRDSQELG